PRSRGDRSGGREQNHSYDNDRPVEVKCRANAAKHDDLIDYCLFMDQNVDDLQDRFPAIRQIDSVDRALLEALSHDARMSLTDLAERINVSRSTAYARLQRLR